MNTGPEILRSGTMHARKGDVKNKFVYKMDLVMIDPDAQTDMGLYSRNRFNVFSVSDKDYGPRGQFAAKWIRNAFEQAGLNSFDLRLLTQPRVLGSLFNPVSFWFAFKGDVLVAFIAEVNNTFKQRHFYLCHHPEFEPITARDEFVSKKVFYVSPFQDIEGDYVFQVDLTKNKFAIRIDFQNSGQGVLATLYGTRAPMTNRAIALATVRRPLGGLRVLGLIFYQAVKLKIKGVAYRVRPEPPQKDLST